MPRLAVTNIRKSYDGNPAVREISFTVEPGRVLALCGENGAGKSTLMRILSGATAPDAGEIAVNGRPERLAGPADAMRLGIRTVYQELSLLPHLSVAENILLGRMPKRRLPFVIDWPEANRQAAAILAAFGFPDIAPTALAGRLSVAQQQIVEIGKALATKPEILILDEPTAVLSVNETKVLFAKVRDLARAGTTILYISHRLEEIFEIADDVVVLKDGRSVLEAPVGELDDARLITAMVGRPLEAIFPERKARRGDVVLQVEELTRPGAFADVGFSVHAGEIVGMFGLVGSGRTEVAQAIFGAEPATAGTTRLNGQEADFATPAAAVKSGLAMITEDRKGDGLALDASVLDNAGLASFGRYSAHGVIDGAKRRAMVDGKVRELSIRPAGTARPVRQLSGGNQQKVVIAKWLLAENTRLFIFDEPTRGVDVATKVEIYQMIADLADSGVAVLLISSELPEILGLSDRILVMRKGRLVAELASGECSPEIVFGHAAGLATRPAGEPLH